MPVISTFYGMIVSLYFLDNRRHKRPHLHVRCQDDEAVVAIPDCELLEGRLPAGKMKILAAWVEIHRDELMADWRLAAAGRHPVKIDPLR